MREKYEKADAFLLFYVVKELNYKHAEFSFHNSKL